ncbi:MAG: aminotransferase class IV [Chloroflexota bacterium]|nr:aminotransferase class IV [Chloroflexota bacterium]
MSRERVVYFNGEIMPETQAKVPIRDSGFLLGDAVFDTTRTFGGKIFKLQEHLDRLFNSLSYMRINPGLSKEMLSDLTMEVLETNLPLIDSSDDYWVSQRITRGNRTEQKPTPTVIIECLPLPFDQRAKYYREGLPITISSIRRTPPESVSPRAKLHHYVNFVLAEMEVSSISPGSWAILLDTNGNLCEGNGANIFVVKDNELFTPKEQYVLPGISRQTTIELAEKLGIECHQTDLDPFDAYNADEIFVTSTSFCICPVSSINGSPVSNGSVPGKFTNQLQQAYSELVGIDIVEQYLSRIEQ